MYIITYIYTRELGYGVLSLWAVWACQGKTAAENKKKNIITTVTVHPDRWSFLSDPPEVEKDSSGNPKAHEEHPKRNSKNLDIIFQAHFRLKSLKSAKETEYQAWLYRLHMLFLWFVNYDISIISSALTSIKVVLQNRQARDWRSTFCTSYRNLSGYSAASLNRLPPASEIRMIRMVVYHPVFVYGPQWWWCMSIIRY